MSAVLIVDDEPLIRWALKRFFESRYEVLEAADGSSAVEQVAHHQDRIAFGLVDLNLPDGERMGIKILRTLKAHAPAARAVVMTAFATPELVEEALAAGACAVVDKPFDLNAVARVVETTCLKTSLAAIRDVP